MRSLKSFLLEEMMLHEKDEKSSKWPEGFEEVQMKGAITDQLKGLLNITSSKALNIKSSQAKSKIKALDKDGKKEIIKDLDLASASGFKGISKKFAASPEMKRVFTGAVEFFKIDGDEAVKFKLAAGFENLAGARPSTLKFIKFWCENTYMAKGIKIETVLMYTFLQNEKTDEFIVVSH